PALLARAQPVLRPPPRALFPYTTRFRSRSAGRGEHAVAAVWHLQPDAGGDRPDPGERGDLQDEARALRLGDHRAGAVALHLHVRSEEHTSELPSRENLVCRLLPDKNNTA